MYVRVYTPGGISLRLWPLRLFSRARWNAPAATPSTKEQPVPEQLFRTVYLIYVRTYLAIYISSGPCGGQPGPPALVKHQLICGR